MNPYAHHHACYRCDGDGAIPVYAEHATEPGTIEGKIAEATGYGDCPDCNGTGEIECSDRRCEEEPL